MILEPIFNIGNYNDLSDKESKRVVLLNKIAFLGIVSITCIGIASIIVDEEKRIPLTLISVFEIIFLVVIFFLHRIRKYHLARIVICVISYIFIFLLSKVIKTDIHNDYYFSALAILPLLFFNNKIIIYTGLIIAILCFYYDKGLYDLILTGKFQFTNQTNSALLLFVIIFLIVNYFKTLNEKNEESLEKKTQELEALNNFQSQFFINISHEIRTPLSLIKGNNELLGEQQVTEYNPDVQKYHKNIKTQTEKIGKIVDDVLDLAKMNANEFQLEKKSLVLNDFLKRLHFSFDSAFRQKKIDFYFDDCTEQCIVNIDDIYLERAFNNLILNALKYTNEGGKVIIKLHQENNNDVTVIIKDTGIGIKEENLTKVFNRFFQADNIINKAGGSGIGLAFSKEVIDMHDGSIHVDSILGEGSEFKIKFPLVSLEQKIEADAIIPETIAIESDNFKTPLLSSFYKNHILIVDDNIEMRTYIKELLQKYNCSEASNGIEALEILKNKPVDFIITDYMMPKMDGYQLIKEIKKLQITIPILMLTARGNLKDKLNILSLGIDDYITKPFSKEELIIRIHNALLNNESKKGYINKTSTNTENSSDEKLIISLKDYILKTCSNLEFELENIVEEFAISKSTIYRKIKHATGLNPNQFINEIKLQKAREIVESNQMDSLKQLSYAVGFSKSSYFSKLYEKRFGSKPFQKGS